MVTNLEVARPTAATFGVEQTALKDERSTRETSEAAPCGRACVRGRKMPRTVLVRK